MTKGDQARVGEVAAYLEEMCAELRALAREHGLADAARYLHASERVAALEASKRKRPMSRATVTHVSAPAAARAR